jgi:mannose-6-phosphate isomerase-like protein (cupin superfamily)
MAAGAQVLRPGGGRRIDVCSRTFLVKAGADRPDGGDFSVLELCLGAGQQGPSPHVHRRHEELFYVVEGVFEFLLDTDRSQLGPGSFIRVPPGCRHSFSNPGRGPARFVAMASPAGMEQAFEEMATLSDRGALDERAILRLWARYDTELSPTMSTVSCEVRP